MFGKVLWSTFKNFLESVNGLERIIKMCGVWSISFAAADNDFLVRVL